MILLRTFGIMLETFRNQDITILWLFSEAESILSVSLLLQVILSGISIERLLDSKCMPCILYVFLAVLRLSMMYCMYLYCIIYCIYLRYRTNDELLLFLLGGADPRDDDIRGKSVVVSTVWSYEPVTCSWYSESGLAIPRKNFGLIVHRMALYAIGGQDKKGR